MITVSAGHYGPGTGAIGMIDEVTEAIKVTKEVVRILRASGITTNYIEDNVSKSQAANLGWLVVQHNKTSRLIDVSLHFNASEGTHDRAIGTEVLYVNPAVKEIANQVSAAIAKAADFIDRGAKKRVNLGFLNGTHKKALLIEVCFVNSKTDVELYFKHFDAICHAIAEELATAVGKSIKPSTISNAMNKKENESMLTETGRIAIRELIKKARDKEIISKLAHTDAKIAGYTDKQLLSYQAAIINSTFK